MSRLASPTRRHALARSSSLGEELGLLHEDANQHVPVGQQRRERVHLLERRDVRLVLLEEAVPRLERAARIVAPPIVHAREAREELALADPLGLGDSLFVGVG